MLKVSIPVVRDLGAARTAVPADSPGVEPTLFERCVTATYAVMLALAVAFFAALAVSAL